MRIETTVTSMSWIPTESLRGALKTGMDLKLSHWDDPPPDRLRGAEHVHELCREDKFRFANLLSVWAEVDGDTVVDSGHHPDSGLVMGATTVMVGGIGATFRAASLPVLQRPAEPVDGGVRFVQTVGGRTALPLPRPVPHPPFIRWQAPLVWTTLALTVRTDGTSDVELTGASAFPRHWVYDATGTVALKSGLTDQTGWMKHSFGVRTPWRDRDREALVVEVESELERQLSHDIMRGGTKPQVRRLKEGAVLTQQGDEGDELYLLLDGVVSVDVDGRTLAELGPGAVVGERALLEGGRRTSTVTALSPLRVAVAALADIDLGKLRSLAESHHREDLVESPAE